MAAVLCFQQLSDLGKGHHECQGHNLMHPQLCGQVQTTYVEGKKQLSTVRKCLYVDYHYTRNIWIMFSFFF